MDIKNHLNTLSFKQLKNIAKLTNLHYHIKLRSKAIVIEALNKLYNYENGVYRSKPFELVIKDEIPKQHLIIKKKPKVDVFASMEKKPIEKQKIEKKQQSKLLKFEDFNDANFIREAIDLYFRDKGKKLSNLWKFNKNDLKEVIEERKIDLNELSNFYILAILNEFMNVRIPEKYKKMINNVKTNKLSNFMNNPGIPENYRQKLDNII